jgi:hypothetical protein
MSAHDFMKSTAVLPFETVQNAVLNRYSNDGSAVIKRRASFKRRLSLKGREAFDESKHFVRRINVENLLTKSSHTITSRRFYIESTESPEYNEIGWILHDGVTNCMFCGVFFGALQAKHNCSACGLVACAQCSGNYAFVSELNDNKKHRVCKNCNKQEAETIVALDKFKRAPRGRISESITPVAASLADKNASPNKLLSVEEANDITVKDTLDETGSQYSESASIEVNPHFVFMKDITAKPLHEVQLEHKRAQGGHTIKRRASLVRQNSQQGVYVISDLVEESFPLPNGSLATANRVYVSSSTGGAYADLGWVIKDELSHCMECFKSFGAMRSKYHCKSCGDVVCKSCVSHQRVIAELGSLSAHRVCGRCDSSCAKNEDLHIRLRRTPLSRRTSSFRANNIQSLANTGNGNEHTTTIPFVNTNTDHVEAEAKEDSHSDQELARETAVGATESVAKESSDEVKEPADVVVQPKSWSAQLFGVVPESSPVEETEPADMAWSSEEMAEPETAKSAHNTSETTEKPAINP